MNVLLIFSGFGVFAKQEILPGTFLFEYEGEKITKQEGERRLCKDQGPGYLFFFGKFEW